jgi:peptidoglycan hydrolase-like protein with peptidoglycan-binding domain
VPDIRLSTIAAVATTAIVIALPASAQAVAFGTRTLKQGMSGSDVKTAQKLLIKTGQRLTADGQFGPATKRAVTSFEETEGLRPNGRLETSEAPTLEAAAEGASSRSSDPEAMDDSTGATEDTTATTPTSTTTSATGGTTTTMGGATPTATPTTTAPAPLGPGDVATLNADGTATAPASAPPEVQAIIAAGNEIASKPYRYGGGHTRRWKDSGYDCSGSVSYALHGAGLLDAPMPSGNFETWGDPGPGQWVTIYARGDHMYMIVAGLRFDTSGAKPSRWQTTKRSSRGFVVRHPTGL